MIPNKKKANAVYRKSASKRGIVGKKEASRRFASKRQQRNAKAGIRAGSQMGDSVRDWYMDAFPSDDMGTDIKPNVTFSGVALQLANGHGEGIYDYIGAYDSLIRERIFDELADIIGVDYDTVYYAWLGKDTGSLSKAMLGKNAAKRGTRRTRSAKIYEFPPEMFDSPEHKRSFSVAFDTIYSLSSSQGIYSRLWEEMLESDFEPLIDITRTINFNDALDFIMWYESGVIPTASVRKAMRRTASDGGWSIFIGAVPAPVCGKWVELPCSDADIDEAIAYACAEYEKYNGEPCEETMIPDYEGPFGMSAKEMEWADPYELNEMVQKFEDSGLPFEVIECALDCGYDADDLDDIWYIEADDDASLAYTYIDEMGGVEELGRDTLERYFDYESFGRDLAFDFYQGDGVYVHTASSKTSGKKYIWGIGKSAFFAGLKAGGKHAAWTTMKVRDLIEKDIDIDVADDYTEDLYIAFCGPLHLTQAGMAEFGDVMDMDVDVSIGGQWGSEAVVHVDDDEDKLRKAIKFFHAAAGYCTSEDWDKWFTL